MKPGGTRPAERSLLLYPSVLVLGGSTLFFLLNGRQQGVLLHALILALAFYLVHLVWGKSGFLSDQFLFPLAAYLTITGYIFIYRLDQRLAVRQFWWALAGLTVLLVITTIFRDYRFWGEYRYVYLWVGLLFLLGTLLVGTEAGGAKSWLAFGPVRFQPAEVVKVLLVFFLASYFDMPGVRISGSAGLEWNWWGPLFLMVGMSLLLLAFQRDLGTALIFCMIFLAMLYVSNGQWQAVGLGLLIFGVGALGGFYFFDHIRTRVAIWVDPWPTLNSNGYQLVQALFAFGSGGIAGSGIGLGSPQQIPAAATDFILAAIGEEQGLLGSSGVVILYLIFAFRGLRVALRAMNMHGRLLAFGLVFSITFQAWLIMAGVTKLLPLTGVTLPFASYGGSSLVASFWVLGVLLNVSHYSEKIQHRDTRSPFLPVR